MFCEYSNMRGTEEIPETENNQKFVENNRKQIQKFVD